MISVLILLYSSVLKVLDYIPNYITSVNILPPNLKDRLLYLMCKRGLITDINIAQVSYLTRYQPFIQRQNSKK